MDEKENFFIEHEKEEEIEPDYTTAAKEYVSEKNKFDFAQRILLGIAILYLLSIAGYIACDIWGSCADMASSIFDKSTIVLPPLASFVIAYYFKQKM